MPQTKQLTFRLAKLTKGALRYEELNASGEAVGPADGAMIGTVYLRKSAVDGQPEQIKVTVEY